MKGLTGSGKFYAIECDLLIKEEIEKAFEWVKTNLKTIHVLVSNAGILTTTTIESEHSYRTLLLIKVLILNK